MSAIITDQLRILNSESFVSGVGSTANSYYVWIGLPNATEFDSDWAENPPAPKDSFSEERDYWDTMLALKRINAADVVRVVRKINWSSGTTFEMYRDDYSRSNTSPVTSSTTLYDTNYYVMNSDYRVYVCLQNGTNPENPDGRPSLDEPLFTDLEPRSAGTSGDGYIWKYLFTIKPNDLIKFDSTSFIPLPKDWLNNNDVVPKCPGGHAEYDSGETEQIPQSGVWMEDPSKGNSAKIYNAAGEWVAEWVGGDPDCDHQGEDFRAHAIGSSVNRPKEIFKYKCKKCGAVRGKDNQIGLEDTPDQFIKKLVGVFREVKRTMKNTGTLWINMGDSYYKKELLGMPWRFALAMQQSGWYLRQDIIWHKPNPMPESVKDRCTKSHEYLFLLPQI